MLRRAVALVVASATIASAFAATDPATPDWPCVQRKVPHLSAAQMWDGPPLEGLADWRADPELAKLVPEIAARRTPLEKAGEMIRDYADTLDEAVRDERLSRLFAGTLETIDLDRSILIARIERYFRRQKELAEKIRRMAGEISDLRRRATADETVRAKLAEIQERYDWDTRVFGERQESLSFICETPVILEQRAFDLAREIRSLMRE